MAHLSLSLLGPFQATLDGKPIAGFRTNKVRALLAYLEVKANQTHPRQVLATLLWPEREDDVLAPCLQNQAYIALFRGDYARAERLAREACKRRSLWPSVPWTSLKRWGASLRKAWPDAPGGRSWPRWCHLSCPIGMLREVQPKGRGGTRPKLSWPTSLRLLEEGQARLEAARTQVAWGTVCRDRGDLAGARAHWEQAAAQWESSDLDHELARTRALVEGLALEWEDGSADAVC